MDEVLSYLFKSKQKRKTGNSGYLNNILSKEEILNNSEITLSELIDLFNCSSSLQL